MRSSRTTGREKRARGRVLAALLCACLAVFGLSSCRPTDFFTEVIISPYAEEVDEDNPDKTIVNEPDSEEESDQLSALDWTEESEQSEEEENLVVYSSDPNTALSTHHTVFDLYPLLSGVEASDGVRVVYDADAIEDNETEEGLEEPEDAESISLGGESSTQDAETSTSEEAESTSDSTDEEGEATGDAGEDESEEGGDQSGETAGDGDDNPNNPGEGAGSEGEGTEDNPSGGYGGEIPIYNAGDAFSEVPRVDSLAVIGSDVAVLVQAIGGEGAICAMSEDAYWGGEEDTTAASFSEVFNSSGDLGDQEAFEADCLVWNNDGLDSSDLTDEGLETLLAALEEADLGDGGVIIYDQNLGDQSTFFDEEQREAIADAGVTMLPVDLTSVQGILDAVNVVGDALEQSSCANDAASYAKSYRQSLKSIVSGVADLHGGDLAALNKNGYYTLLSDYNNCPITTASVIGGQSYPIVSCIATDAVTGWSYTGSYDIDVSSILLFGSSDYDASPLAFWGQVAGVAPHSATQEDNPDADTDLFWPYKLASPVDMLSGSGSTYSQWLGSDSSWSPMQAGPSSTNEGFAITETYGLGSYYVPYLVVSATDELTADEVRELTIESVESYGTSSITTAYSAFPFATGSSGDEAVGIVPMNSSGLRSTIGAMNAESKYSESPFYTSLEAEDVVRANPCGLLGSWTEGSLESVLECIWLGELYSKSADGCDFEPFNDFDELSVTIGDVECTSTEEAVKQFYSYFYRVSGADLDSYFDAAVPDQLDDL